MFMHPEVSLVAMVITNSSVDTQELAVSRSLNLSGGDELLAGGVQPLVQDDISGYYFEVLDEDFATTTTSYISVIMIICICSSSVVKPIALVLTTYTKLVILSSFVIKIFSFKNSEIVFVVVEEV